MTDMLIVRKGRLYLVFEYVEKNLLEVLEENTVGIDVSKRQTFSISKSDKIRINEQHSYSRKLSRKIYYVIPYTFKLTLYVSFSPNAYDSTFIR